MLIDDADLEQTKLRVLDLGANKISKLENVSHSSELEEFWVRPNLAYDVYHLMRFGKHRPITTS